MDQDIIEVNFYKSFLGIALRNFTNLKILIQKRKQINAKTDRDIDDVCILNSEIQRRTMIIVLFCHMTLESFINCYALGNYSNKYFS